MIICQYVNPCRFFILRLTFGYNKATIIKLIMEQENNKTPLLKWLKINPKYRKMPKALQDWFEKCNLNDQEAIINYLCLAAQHVLNKGAKEAAINMLELAEELALQTEDEHLAAQIGAWIGLIESNDSVLIDETIDLIKEVINNVVHDEEFMKTIGRKKD